MTLLRSVAGFGAFIGLWSIAALVSRSDAIPSVVSAFKGGYWLLAGGFFVDLLATLARSVAGWLLGMAVALPVGLLLGHTSVAYDYARGVLAFMRSLPAFLLVMIPLGLGIGGEVARLSVISAAIAFITVDACATSLLSASKDRQELVRVYGGGVLFILRRVLFYEALGRAIIPAARTTVSIAFVIAIICETLLTPVHGVGVRLLTSLSAFDMAATYGFLLLTALAGLLLNSLIHKMGLWLVTWSD